MELNTLSSVTSYLILADSFLIKDRSCESAHWLIESISKTKLRLPLLASEHMHGRQETQADRPCFVAKTPREREERERERDRETERENEVDRELSRPSLRRDFVKNAFFSRGFIGNDADQKIVRHVKLDT